MPAKQVLVVDDDETVRMFISAIMEDEGWVCLEARHGQECLDACELSVPDLVIMDLEMPVLDGFETFRRLRDDPHTEKVPIIILTGKNAEDTTQVYYTADDLEAAFGVPKPEGFVDKPVSADHLRKCILGVIG
jgi:two-component system alkaline phosphatase synthesis response regulator PhoP